MIKKFEQLKDFCADQGELQMICREFNCNGNEIVLTQEQADYKASISPSFKLAREIMNQEPIEIYIDPF